MNNTTAQIKHTALKLIKRASITLKLKRLYKYAHMADSENKKCLETIQSIIKERPIAISVETYSLCNARCVFCARRKMPASRELMPMDLFERICTQYSDLGGGFFGFSPMMADPLLDPLFIQRVQLLRDKFPTITPHMFTNLIALDKYSDEHVLAFLETLDHIDISIGGTNREGYRRMFGVDKYESVVNSLQRLSSLNKTRKTPREITLYIRTNKKAEVLQSADLAKFMESGFICAGILDEFSDWGGLVGQDDLPDGATITKRDNACNDTACLLPMIYMTIMPDGKVLGCSCMDGKNETVSGDLTNSNLKEVWTSDEFNSFRNSFFNKEIRAICKSCSYYVDYELFCSNKNLAAYKQGENIWEYV